MSKFSIRQQYRSSLSAAKVLVPEDIPVVDLLSCDDRQASNLFTDFLQGHLEKSVAFLIPWDLILLAESALFKAPFSSSEVFFIAKPAGFFSRTAMVLSREPNEL